MRKSIRKYAMLLAVPVVALMTSCEPKGLTEEDVFIPTDSTSLAAILAQENPAGYDFYELEQFLDSFMHEEGNYHDSCHEYRERSYDSKHKVYLFTIDTIPNRERGIYIRGRVTTDDYGGNFYKSMIIQQVVAGKQQNLRISVDLGSSAGMYQIGQEIIIRCNGLAIGRYANQPQLCAPSYNNNIYAMVATQKTGWVPGRIQGSVFRRVAKMIGTPRPDLLKYDTMELKTLFGTKFENGTTVKIKAIPLATKEDMDFVRKIDGRLIVLKNVYFTGKYVDGDGSSAKVLDCVVGHPDTVGGANVFAPSTQNINYPQGRLMGAKGTSNQIMCSNSEYAKFAYYYLPGADKTGISGCKQYTGTVTGVLGWYFDNGSNLATEPGDKSTKRDSYEWSVTPRGIPGFGIADIVMENDHGDPWRPQEYDPNDK